MTDSKVNETGPPTRNAADVAAEAAQAQKTGSSARSATSARVDWSGIADGSSRRASTSCPIGRAHKPRCSIPQPLEKTSFMNRHAYGLRQHCFPNAGRVSLRFSNQDPCQFQLKQPPICRTCKRCAGESDRSGIKYGNSSCYLAASTLIDPCSRTFHRSRRMSGDPKACPIAPKASQINLPRPGSPP